MRMLFLILVFAAIAAGYFSLTNGQAVEQIVKNVSPAEVAADWNGPGPVWEEAIRKSGRYHETFNYFLKVVGPPANLRKELLAKLKENRPECLYYIASTKGIEAIYIFANFQPLPERS